MLMAVIGDINGDVTALAAALTHIDEQGIHTIVHAGSAVGTTANPNDVIAVLRARRIWTVQGPQDRLVAQFLRKNKTFRAELSAADYERLRQTYETIQCDNIEFLQGLPRKREFAIDGFSVFLAGCDSLGLDADCASDTSRLRRVREHANTNIVIVGGIPRPFSVLLDNTLIVAPGPLKDETGAVQWMQVTTEEEPWRADIQRISLP